MAKCKKCDAQMGYGQVRCIVCGQVQNEDASGQASLLLPAPDAEDEHYAFKDWSRFCLMALQIASFLGIIFTVIAWGFALCQGLWLYVFVWFPLAFVFSCGNFYLVARVRAMMPMFKAWRKEQEGR